MITGVKASNYFLTSAIRSFQFWLLVAYCRRYAGFGHRFWPPASGRRFLGHRFSS
jgi:hypothetical protein